MAAAVGERPIERGAIFGAELFAVGRGRRAEIPDDRHRRQRLLRPPEIVGDDRHAIRHRHGGDDAAPAGDRGKVIGFQLAAEDGAIGGGGEGHAGQARIDAEARCARDLERRIDSLQPGAEELELIGRLDRRLDGQRDLGGVGREFAEHRRAGGRFVANESAAGDAGGRFDAPSRGRRGEEPGAGGSARLLQEDPRTAHRRRTARSHRLVDPFFDQIAVGGGVLDLHPGKVAFQLLGEDHRQRRHDALTHLGFSNAQGDGIVRVDHDEGADLSGRQTRLRAPGLAGERRRARQFGRERRDCEAAGSGIAH